MKRIQFGLIALLCLFAAGWQDIPGEFLQRPRNSVADFGARGDSTADGGGTDDTAEIQAALDAAKTNGDMQATVIVPAGKFYRITSQLVVPSTVDFICEGDGTIVYDNTDNTTAILVGATDALYQRRRLRINLKRATTSTWLSENSIGVAVCNPVESEMDFARVDGFTIGIQWKAHLAAAYNYGIKLGRIMNNKFGIDLHSFHANGFPNENHFIGGRFSYTTGTNTGLSRYAIRFKTESGCYANHNNNVFDGFTVELSDSQASPGVARAVLIENNAILNKFVNYRTELNTEPHIEITGSEACRNTFLPLFNNEGAAPLPTDFILWSGNRKSDVVLTPEATLYQTQSEWNSGDLPTKTVQRTSGGFERTHTIGIHWETSGGGGSTSLIPALHLTNSGDYLTPSGSNPAACIVVDATKNKRFVVRKRVSSGSPGRFAIRVYDGHPLDGGAIITSGAAGLVRGMTSGVEATWSAGSYGGAYVRGSDSDADWMFSVDDSVKYFVVINQNATIAAFSVGTLDPDPIRCFPLHGINDGHHYMDAAPDAANLRLGQVVLNSAKTAASTSPTGWVCTTAATTVTAVYAAQPITNTWESGDLPTKTTQRTTGGFEKTHTVGIHWEVGAGSGATALVQSLHLTNNGDFLTPTGSSPSACIVFDCTTNKHFLARKNVDATVNSGGRFAIRCYDGHPLDGGSIITSGADLVTIQTTGIGSIAWQSGTNGGSYLMDSDSDSPLEFTVDASVKYAVLICYNAAINSFSLSTFDAAPIHCFPLHGVNDGLRYMDDTPDTGSYKEGTVVFNADQFSTITIPTTWTCFVEGTPGSWFPSYRGQLTLVGTATWDPASLADDASTSTTLTVTGAVAGNVVLVSLSTLTQDGLQLTGTVSAANTVKVTLANIGGTDPTDVGSGTLMAQVFQ